MCVCVWCVRSVCVCVCVCEESVCVCVCVCSRFKVLYYLSHTQSYRV